MAESPWGWDRYERTPWVRQDGKTRLYVGHFRMDNDPHHWTIVEVRFWAKRPIVALRTICHSGRNPVEFADQIIN